MLKVVIRWFLSDGSNLVRGLIKEKDDREIVAGISRSTGLYEGEIKVYKNISEFDGSCDVIIDFSHPDTLDSLLEYAKTNKTPLVLATTGYSDNDMRKLKILQTQYLFSIQLIPL